MMWLQSEGRVSVVMTDYCAFSTKIWSFIVLSHSLNVWESPSILQLLKLKTATEIHHISQMHCQMPDHG